MVRAPQLFFRSRPRVAALALALAGGALALVLGVWLFPYHSLNHDEGVYLQQAALLLDGQLRLHPPVSGAFRPWFFVDAPQGLYPKYTPYPAVLYAIGMVLGSARFALFGIGAAVVGLTSLLGTEVSGRKTGLLAAGFMLVSPLFVVDSATFLPYAPVAALNLGFAYSYFRAERTRNRGWALLAGALVGIAFFARPYTALVFALPFVGHALVTLAARRDRTTLVRRTATAGLGICGVVLALAYNQLMTGDFLKFPYQAFAPNDGLGFGSHSLRGYSHDYTPIVALRANAVVVWRLFTRWVAGGPLGSALAALGLVRVLRRGRAVDGRLLVLAGLYPSVILGNVFFWGNYNVLGPGFDATTGLIHLFGPYYHFGLLAPTGVFAALGLRWLFQQLRPRFGDVDRRAVFVVGLVGVVVGAAALGGVLVGPLARNAEVTDGYEQGYAPFADSDGPPANSVVFLPQTYGPWLAHPYQYLSNDPGFDGRTLYALDGANSLAVTDAYPDRTYYRYAFRGTWVPTDDIPVHPALNRVRVTRGRTVTERLTVRLPPGTDFATLRVAAGGEQAYYSLNATPGDHTMAFAVNRSRVAVGGEVSPANANGPSLPVNRSDDVTATVYVETGPGAGFSYRSRLPVGIRNGTRVALTPALEACTDGRTCGGGAAYLPERVPDEYSINATVTAVGETTSLSRFTLNV